MHMQSFLPLYHLRLFEHSALLLNKTIAENGAKSPTITAQQIVVNDIIGEIRSHHHHLCRTDRMQNRHKRQLGIGVALGVFVMSVASSIIGIFTSGFTLPDNKQCQAFQKIVGKLGKNQDILKNQLNAVTKETNFNIHILNLLAEKEMLTQLLNDFQEPTKHTQNTKHMVMLMLNQSQHINGTINMKHYEIDDLLSFQVHLTHRGKLKHCINSNLSIIAELKIPGATHFFYNDFGVVENRHSCLLHDPRNTIQLNKHYTVLSYPTISVETVTENCTIPNTYICEHKLAKTKNCSSPKNLLEIYKNNVILHRPATIEYTCTNNDRLTKDFRQAYFFQPHPNCKYEIHFSDTTNIFVINKVHSEVMKDFVLKLHIQKDFSAYGFKKIELDTTANFPKPQWHGLGFSIPSIANTLFIIAIIAFACCFWKKYRSSECSKNHPPKKEVRFNLN